MRLISLDTQDHTTVVLPIQNILHAVVVEFDPVEGFVYWTDQDLHLIKRARLNGSGELIELCAWSNINIVRSMIVLHESVLLYQLLYQQTRFVGTGVSTELISVVCDDILHGKGL